MQPPVRVQGTQRGSSVPGGDFCPQAGAFLWMRRGNSSRLSTQRELFVEVRCREGLLSTDRGIFVDAEGNSNRLSTQEVLFVEVWCREGTFVHKKGIFCGRGKKMLPPVHAEGAFCGSLVPGGDFCPRTGALFVDVEGDLLNYFVIGKLNS